jgi:hypothetical protein
LRRKGTGRRRALLTAILDPVVFGVEVPVGTTEETTLNTVHSINNKEMNENI